MTIHTSDIRLNGPSVPTGAALRGRVALESLWSGGQTTFRVDEATGLQTVVK